jgi:hypothetical protein
MGISGDDCLPGKHQRLRICVDGRGEAGVVRPLVAGVAIEFDAVRGLEKKTA